MVSAMALGADCIEDCDVLRSGQTAAVLGHRVVGAIDARDVPARVHVRARPPARPGARPRASRARGQPGAGPGDERLVVDVDSFVGEVHGHDKQGAAFGYTRVRGYHPILATRAETGEVLHIRCRKGSANTSRGMLRFVDELIARVDARRRDRPEAAARRLGVLEQARPSPGSTGRAGSSRSASACNPHVRAAIEAIDETRLDDAGRLPADGDRADRRDDARRAAAGRPPRPHPRSPRPSCCRPGSTSRSSTNRTDALALVEAEHRQHAVVELAIRDLKDQALAHFPSGSSTPTPPGR